MSDDIAADIPSRAEMAKVLGKNPSGLFILTATNGEGLETGMLASWVQQASFDPPAVTVAINQKRYIHDWLKKQSTVVLNLIGEKQNEFLKQYGRGFEPDQPAFEGMETGRSETGLPYLKGALGYLEGKVQGQLDSGDHIVYLIELTSAGIENGEVFEESSPWVHIRKNGFNY